MIELDVGRTRNADLRMLERLTVNLVLGDLGELVDKRLRANPLRDQLAQRLLDDREKRRLSHTLRHNQVKE